jgi:beta-lactam-binding protein with PASTA domain
MVRDERRPQPFDPAAVGLNKKESVVKKITAIAALALLALVGCGGNDKAAAVPDVVGERLDVAQALVKDAGLEAEAIGGGTFGIINESNWSVCRTEPAAGTTGAGKVRLIVDRVCATSHSGAGQSDGTAAPVAESSTTTAPSSSTTSSPPHAQATLVRVPNVVGKDLQTAQDTMQAAGLWNLTSHDSTGQNRMQILDRNWLVTGQSPSAGTMVNTDQLIDLGARKLTD